MTPVRSGGRRASSYTCEAQYAMRFERVTVDPAVFGGKPCIRGMRFPVSRLLVLLLPVRRGSRFCANYPYLEAEDIDEALRYAAV